MTSFKKFNKLKIIQLHANPLSKDPLHVQLRTPAIPVEFKGEQLAQPELIQSIVNDMLYTHYHTDHCAALAATQLHLREFYPELSGIPAITVIDFTNGKNEPLCLLNAEILLREGELIDDYYDEGCMSIAGGDFHARVPRDQRHKKIQVKAFVVKRDPKDTRKLAKVEDSFLVDVTQGCWEIFEAEDYLSKCIAHELDHLLGKLFIDLGGSLKRQRNLEQFQKLMRR